MTNWTEQLPEHTKLDYYECYAKIVLEELFPTEFVDIEIKDKPDLQMKNGKYGVEVTRAIDRDQLEAESLATKIVYNGDINISKAMKKIEKCGCKLEKGVLAGKSGTDSFSFILSAFDKKLKLLNGNGYKYFNKNCLFIFSDILADDEMIIEAIQEMQRRQISMERQFYKVFVLVPGYCYSLDLYIGSYEIHIIESELQCAQACKAREIVEEYEKIK